MDLRRRNGAFSWHLFSRCEHDGPMLSSGALCVSLSDPTILITIHGRKGGRSSENERAKELKAGDSREKRQGELVVLRRYSTKPHVLSAQLFLHAHRPPAAAGLVQVQSAVCRSRTTCWPLCPYPVRRPPAIFITMAERTHHSAFGPVVRTVGERELAAGGSSRRRQLIEMLWAVVCCRTT
jgi:hypothetical protein